MPVLDDHRRLQPVKLDVLGVEKGRERYQNRDGDYSPPQLASWRNNLTALSHQHNLFFVAHRDEIAVFQPSIPSHRLGSRPLLNIRPTLANRNALGYLDQCRPHSINHLVIGDLGSEEILFLSTDSGNVAAYYTAAIYDGAQREPYKFSNDGRGDLVGIRPFFTHWVYESAWGLSIHKHARMLAVSSNRPCDPNLGTYGVITVFAFALTNSSRHRPARSAEMASSGRDQSEWRIWVKAKDEHKLPDRSVNWKTELRAHSTNIPSVSFVNSDDDLQGEYLVSTDIDGMTKLWHIWYDKRIKRWDFSLPRQRVPRLSFSPQQTAGWAVLSLDPACFRIVDTIEEFCGIPHGSPCTADHSDITQGLAHVPGHDGSLPLTVIPSRDGESDDEAIAELGQSGDAMSDPIPDHEEEDIRLEHDLRSRNSVEPTSIDLDLDFSSEDQIESDEDELDDNASENSMQAPAAAVMEIDSNTIEPEDLSVHWSDLAVPGGNLVSDGYDLEIGTFNGANQTNLGHPGLLSTENQPSARSPPPKVPTLHLSASHLRLFDAYSASDPVVTCSDVLAFQRAVYYPAQPSIDRLNMTQYIPELGVVVIATQIGRAAVCSLTTRGSNGPFGVRVDWILPFEEQENEHQRPAAPLIGIAAGPVPGYDASSSSSISGSDDDEDADSTWLCDRVDEDGVSITFDRTVVMVPPPPPSPFNSYGGGGSSSSTARDPCQKIRKSEPAFTTASPPPSIRGRTKAGEEWAIVDYAWPSRGQTRSGDESWRGLEYSRRYRLMMTYADHGVMTYELSRQAPFVGDPGLGRPNWRNRDEPWL